MTPARAVFTGGLVVGVLDGLDALIFFGIRSGARPIRIFQSIASGLLGKASFSGGIPAALLGVLCHFTVATGIVTVYVLASRKLRVLTEQPVICGIVYGIVAYLVMNYVVIPLSAVPPGGAKPFPVIANGVLIHMFGVGLPAALVARRADGRTG